MEEFFAEGASVYAIVFSEVTKVIRMKGSEQSADGHKGLNRPLQKLDSRNTT
jgi:hypothetical protein